MSDLVWTTEKPTKPGAYWFRGEDGLRLCYLKPDTYLDLTAMEELTTLEVCSIKVGRTLGTFCQGEISKWSGEWAGPIAEPKERPSEETRGKSEG